MCEIKYLALALYNSSTSCLVLLCKHVAQELIRIQPVLIVNISPELKRSVASGIIRTNNLFAWDRVQLTCVSYIGGACILGRQWVNPHYHQQVAGDSFRLCRDHANAQKLPPVLRDEQVPGNPLRGS